jgi:hypothetical protein
MHGIVSLTLPLTSHFPLRKIFYLFFLLPRARRFEKYRGQHASRNADLRAAQEIDFAFENYFLARGAGGHGGGLLLEIKYN